MLMWILGAFANAQEETCDRWWEITEIETTEMFAGDSISLSLVGDSLNCDNDESVSMPDLSLCEWTLDPPQIGGSLSPAEGTSTIWAAPETLTDCVTLGVEVSVECPDGAGGITFDKTSFWVDCTDEQLEEYNFSEKKNWSLGGGGCTSPQYALFALFPLFGRFSRRRFRG